MRVIGKIVEEESGRALAGLQVRAFDKDIFFDDKLGVAITDAKGDFRIEYSATQFSFMIETSPELYVRVHDAKGRLLYSSKNAIRKDPMVEERYDIKIPKAKLG